MFELLNIAIGFCNVIKINMNSSECSYIWYMYLGGIVPIILLSLFFTRRLFV